MSNDSSQTNSKCQSANVFVGRQPIFKSNLKTFGYELLFCNGSTNQAPAINGEFATAELIRDTFTEIGLEKVVGDLPAFINITEEFLINGYCLALPRDRVVLEILEDVNPTQHVLDALSSLRDEGFTIALDGFVMSRKQQPLIEYADIIKVEYPSIPRNQLIKCVERLKKVNVKLLAEKIELEEEFLFCKNLGFDYFQGYFLCKPVVIQQERVAVHQMNTFSLIAKLQQPEICLEELTSLIEPTPNLAYKLLRYVNSVCFGIQRKVQSIREAIILLGTRQIKTFLYLIVLVDSAKGQPEELVKMALIRAKMSELLGLKIKNDKQESFFLMGLLSAMDVLLKLPKDDVVKNIPLCENIRKALVHQTGVFGEVLGCVLEYEQGNWKKVSCGSLGKPVILDAYLQAVKWASDSYSVHKD